MLSTNPPIRFVRDFSNGNPTTYPCPGANCIFKGRLHARVRPARHRVPAVVQPQRLPLSWFKTNHLDWLEFKCAASGLTESQAIADGDLAYLASAAGQARIPLDLSNPAALSWIEITIWGPMVAPGQGRQMLDTRNWSMTRGSWTGQTCGHYDTSGNSGQQYNGTLNDPIWREYQISLVSNIQIWLHANYPGIALEANLAWDVNYLADELSFLKHVDIWFDEQGFTDGNSGGGDFTDQARQGTALAVNQIVHGGTEGWFAINQTKDTFVNRPHAERQWAISIYLLFKNSASWIWAGAFKNTAACTSHRSMLPRRSAPRPTPTIASQGVYRRLHQRTGVCQPIKHYQPQNHHPRQRLQTPLRRPTTRNHHPRPPQAQSY